MVVVLPSAVPPVVDSLQMPDEITNSGLSADIKVHHPLSFCHLLLPVLMQNSIHSRPISYDIKLKLFLSFGQFDGANRLDRHLPLGLIVNNLALLVESTLCVIHEHHREHKETRVLLPIPVCLQQEAVVLVAVWLWDPKGLLEEALPFGWKLPFQEMCHDEELFVSRCLELELDHVSICHLFVVTFQNESVFALLKLLDELKVHQLIHLRVTDFDYLRVKLVSLGMENVHTVVSDQDLLVWSGLGVNHLSFYCAATPST